MIKRTFAKENRLLGLIAAAPQGVAPKPARMIRDGKMHRSCAGRRVCHRRTTKNRARMPGDIFRAI